MDLNLTKRQENLRDRLRAQLDEVAPLGRSRSSAALPTGYDPDLWRRLAADGYLAVPFGGGARADGGGFLESCLVLEELARVRAPSPFLSTVLLCGSAIARWGSEPQRGQLLSEIESGDRVLALADAEPGNPWNELPAQTRAHSTDGGFLLEGVKSFVPYARVADSLLVVARLEEGGASPADSGEGLFLVDPAAGGVRIEQLDTVDWDAYCTVTLDRVELPSSAFLGAAQGGLIREWGAAARCAEMVGGADRVLELCTEYVKKRTQFGRPIGSFQAVQHRCADMAVDALSSRLVSSEAIWRLDCGLEATQEVSVAKAWVGEAYNRICSSGHQIHGAIGYTAGHSMQLFYRHARSAELSFGDSDCHREILARHLGM